MAENLPDRNPREPWASVVRRSIDRGTRLTLASTWDSLDIGQTAEQVFEEAIGIARAKVGVEGMRHSKLFLENDNGLLNKQTTVVDAVRVDESSSPLYGGVRS